MRAIFLVAIMFFLPLSAYATERRLNLECTDEPLATADGMYQRTENGRVRDSWNYNRDLVSAAFSLFAAASYDTYSDDEQSFAFRLENTNLTPHWQLLPWNNGSSRYRNSLTGLLFDTYFLKRADCTFVIVAFRGTDFSSLGDWYSNFSPVTRTLPFRNQYDEASLRFRELRDYAKKNLPGKLIFLTTGHSLGGGLAEHIAQCFDSVSAVGFDPSFVTSSLFCRKRYPQVIRIYENGEPFNIVKYLRGPLVRSDRNKGRVRIYMMNSLELSRWKLFAQHSMLGLTAGMLRLNLNCIRERKTECEIPRKYRSQVRQYSSALFCVTLNETPNKIVRNEVTAEKSKNLTGRYDTVCAP